MKRYVFLFYTLLLILAVSGSMLRRQNKELKQEVQTERFLNEELRIQNKALTKDFKSLEVKYLDLLYKEVCSKSTFKSWMDYRAITNTSSNQYKLQIAAQTGKYGIRTLDDYYLVAMGGYYGPVGKKYSITFEDGQVIKVMIGDIKHEGCVSSNDGSMLEFIVDSFAMDPLIRKLGNFDHIFNGKIIEIQKEH